MIKYKFYTEINKIKAYKLIFLKLFFNNKIKIM